MEIPVLAESAGTVSELRVAEGQVVQEGDVIAVIDWLTVAGRRQAALSVRSRVRPITPKHHR